MDGFLLSIFGSVLGVVLFNKLSDLGPWGRLVGFLIALPYFALFESNLGDGQTVGKWLLRLRVVNSQGRKISLEESLLRYFVFAIPFFLNLLELPTSLTPRIAYPLLAILVFGVGGTTLYLLTFNRNTRQGLHDLAVGAYVVEARQSGPVETKPISKIHWMILGLLAVVLTLSAVIVERKFSQSADFTQLLQDDRLIENMSGVQRAGAQNVYESNFRSGDHKRFLVITIYVTSDSPDGQAFADEVAKTILEEGQPLQQYSRLTITVIHGYDLGFASGWRSNSFSHTPVEWSQRIIGIL